MISLQRIKFNLLKLKRKILYTVQSFLEDLFRKYVCDGKTHIQLLYENNYILASEKKLLLNDIIQTKKKTVYFVFRDCQMLDWFIPIHHAIKKTYGQIYDVLYINFGSTISQIGTGVKYLPYYRSIEKRLLLASIPACCHFSNCELDYIENFPAADIIVTSETIRQEKFNCLQRVYLPHYSVPKAKDSLKKSLRYNHIFIPSKAPFTYHDLKFDSLDYKVHKIGYPKMENALSTGKKLFKNGNPTIIYAPSLEADVILSALHSGILQLFKEKTRYNFIIKLHPTLANKMFNIFQLIQKQVKGFEHIKIDTRSNIQDIGVFSSLMITDFGSVGAEYKLKFGKRLIYLKVPPYLEGGGDLAFRDHFADSISNVSDLSGSIDQWVAAGDLSENEKQEMGQYTLYHYGMGSYKAAEAIHEILK